MPAMSTLWMLRLVHLLYAASMAVVAWARKRRRRPPNPLDARRSKIPNHLCLNLVADSERPVEETEDAFLQCLQRVAAWCRALGIETLTVYDRYGILYGCSERARARVFVANETSEDSCESEVEYPLTPPLSEPSGSRSHSPDHGTLPAELNVITMMHLSRLRKRRNVAVRLQPKSGSSTSRNLMLHVVSRASGKPAIVSASRLLLQGHVSGVLTSDGTIINEHPYYLTVSKLAMVLEAGLSPPDFMIIHHIDGMKVPYPPIELHGFPPWQNTLTEFHRTQPDDGQESEQPHSGSSSVPKLISEAAFCRALDEYAGAEFRLGR